MAKRRRGVHWVSLLAINLMVIAVPFLVYFLFYFDSQRDYFASRNFRVLNEVSNQLTSLLQQFGSTFTFTRLSEETVAGDYLTALRQTPAYRRIWIRPAQPDEVTRRCGSERQWSGVRFALDRTTAETQLRVIDCRPPQERTLDEHDSSPPVLMAWLPLTDLVEPEAALKNFDLLLIVQADGHVIYSSDGTFARFGNLQYLLQEGKQTKSFVQNITSTAQHSAEDGEAAGAERQPSLWMEATTHSSVKETQIGETRYILFLQPFRLPLSAMLNGQAAKSSLPVWYLCGVVSKNRFNSDVMSVPLTILGLVVLGLVLGILAWPYLKIWSISPREKLRPTDVYFLAISLILGSGLLTLLLLDTIAYQGLRAQLDHTARQIGRDMLNRFDEELRETLVELRKVSATIGRNLAALLEEHKIADRRTGTCWEDGTNAPQAWPRPDEYPSFELAFLLNEHGTQVGSQVSYRDVEVKGISVPKREYFRRAKTGALWQLRPKQNGKGGADHVGGSFFLERIRTYDHGWTLSVVSMPYAVEGVPQGKRASSANSHGCEARVAVLIKHFQTFWNVVLPPHFGFAVVEDDSGNVIFHSDDRRSLIENFFLEIDRNRSLQAAMTARHHDHSDGQYNGVGHRFYVTPIPHLPWSLIVFYDKTLMQTVNFELVLTAAAHLIFYSVLFGLGIVLANVVVPDARWSWLWPRWELAEQYGHSAGFLVLVVLYYLLSMWSLTGWWLALLVVSAPCFVTGFLYVVFKRTIATHTRRRKGAWTALSIGALGGAALLIGLSSNIVTFGLGIALVASMAGYAWFVFALLDRGPRVHLSGPTPGFRGRYLSTAFVSVIIFAVLPSLTIFKDAFRVHANKLTKFDQLMVARTLEAREQAIQDDAARLKPADYNRPGAKRVQLAAGARCRGIYSYESAQVARCQDHHLSPADRITLDQIESEKQTYWGWYYDLSYDSEVRAHCSGVWTRWSPGRNPRVTGSETMAAEHTRILTRNFTAWLALVFPAYSTISAELRNAIYDAATDGRWHWIDCSTLPPTSHRGRRTGQASALLFYMDGRDGTSQYWLRSAILPFPFLHERGDWLLALGSFGVFLLGLGLIIRFLAARVLGLDLPEFEVLWKERTAREWTAENRVLVRAPGKFVEHLIQEIAAEVGPERLLVLDQLAPAATLVKRFQTDPTQLARREVVILKNFESGFTVPALRLALLEFLEDLVFRQGTRVLICASIFPLYRLIAPHVYPESEETGPSADEALRWSRLFSVFGKERFPADPGGRDWWAIPDRRTATLVRECRWREELQPIETLIKSTPEYARLTEEQIVEHVGDRAEALYRALWMLCTKEERLVLIDLARGNLVNPRNIDVVERLMRRGLIRRDPDFQLVSRSFARFVLTAEPRERVAEWEQEAAESTWAILRVPLFLILLLLGAFLVYMGGETFTATIGTITALFAALPVLVRALAAFRGGQRTQAAEE